MMRFSGLEYYEMRDMERKHTLLGFLKYVPTRRLCKALKGVLVERVPHERLELYKITLIFRTRKGYRVRVLERPGLPWGLPIESAYDMSDM